MTGTQPPEPVFGAPYRKEGGMYSAGSTGGSGWPDMATSMRCMARMNSSAVSFPSWSMSERLLPTSSSCDWFLLARHLHVYLLTLPPSQ